MLHPHKDSADKDEKCEIAQTRLDDMLQSMQMTVEVIVIALAGLLALVPLKRVNPVVDVGNHV